MDLVRPPLLYLAHRIPYPPNKGDKVRSFHILRHLAQHYRVHLGCFVDQDEDWQHVPALRQWCESTRVLRIAPRRERLLSLRGLLSGEALSIPYYRSAELAGWVRDTVRSEGIERAVVFSGAMAQYLDDLPIARRVIDFCDVDSAKWTQYAGARVWPMSWLYRREGRLLSRFERGWAARVEASTFVTAAELSLFQSGSGTGAVPGEVMENGVDADYFSPQVESASPYPAGTRNLVFSGAMDYWPNIDAACWFVQEVMPLLLARDPALRFTVVGMNPAPAVRALAREGVIEVTGTVADVRPYVRHADVVLAPLRVARGIQNKVLEAMSLARPVIVSTASAAGLRARAGSEFLTAGTAAEFADAVFELFDHRRASTIGEAARARVLADYAWDVHLALLPRILESAHGLASASARLVGNGAFADRPVVQ